MRNSRVLEMFEELNGALECEMDYVEARAQESYAAQDEYEALEGVHYEFLRVWRDYRSAGK